MTEVILLWTVNLKSAQQLPKRFLLVLQILRRSAWKVVFMRFLATVVQLQVSIDRT